jgi:hypothetical protein
MDTETTADVYRDALEGHASRFSVGFVFGLFQQHLDMATGVAVNWNSKRIILTAAHVFDGPNFLDGRIVLPIDGPFDRGGRNYPLPSEIHRGIVDMPPGISLARSNLDDLGCFEVDRSFGSFSDIQFLDLPPFAKTPRPGRGFLMLGYPQDLSRPVSDTEAAVNMAGRWTERVRLGKGSRSLKDFRPRAHFLMKFHKADKGEHAAGFSGAGIWFPVVQPQNAIIWRPRIGLAGIQSMWYPNRLLTQAVRVERVVRFLSRQFGQPG